MPIECRYLLEWHRQLAAGRAAGMHDLAPLTWQDLDAWARRTGHDPAPHEADALLLIDAVMRYPDAKD